MLDALKRPTPGNAYLLLAFAMLFWAGNYVVGRWAAGHVPPITLAFLRWTGASLLMLPLAWRQLAAEWPAIRANAPMLLGLGIIGSGLFNTLQYIALSQTTATSAGIFNSATPVLIAVLSFLINGERLTLKQIAGIGMSLAGVLVVVARGERALITNLAFNQGDIIMLVGIVLWAIYTTLLERRPRISVLAFTAVTYVTAALLNLPLAIWEISDGHSIVWSTGAVAAILYTAVLPSFFAYLAFNRGVEIIGPSRAGAFIHLVPLFTTLLAMLFLDEAPALYHVAGFLLILSGVSLAARR